MKLDRVEELSLMESLSEISRILLKKYNGEFLDEDLGVIKNVTINELPESCIEYLRNSTISEFERTYSVGVRSISVSKMFIEVPFEFILGYTVGLRCFLDGSEVDIRVYLRDYMGYPKVEDLLKYVQMGSQRPVSFRNFSERLGILWLHMDEGFIESYFGEDGRVDVSDSSRVSAETLRVMSWVDGVREDISSLYVILGRELKVAYFLMEENGEFSVLVY